MWAIAAAALALIVASDGSAHAATPSEDGFFQRATALVAPFNPARLPDQSDMMAPHAGIDPDMTILPPRMGARMPVVRPPGTLDNPK